MDKQLLAQVSHVTVNFSFMGFSVDSDVPVSGGGGCASCSSGGTCGSGN